MRNLTLILAVLLIGCSKQEPVETFQIRYEITAVNVGAWNIDLATPEGVLSYEFSYLSEDTTVSVNWSGQNPIYIKINPYNSMGVFECSIFRDGDLVAHRVFDDPVRRVPEYLFYYY